MRSFYELVWCRGGSLLVMAFLLASCSSTPKVDWNSRVGSYTYDQAVLDMGPPANSAQLGDGSTVADWFVRYGPSVSFGFGTGMYGGGGGVAVGQTVGGGRSAQYLRLTFGSDGKLRQWARIWR